MQKNILFLFFLTLFSACVTQENPNVVSVGKIDNHKVAQNISDSSTLQENKEFRVIVPPHNDYGYALNPINKRIASSKLSDLRAKALPKNDLEIRIWFYYDIGYTHGIIINRTDGNWSSTFLDWKSVKNRKGGRDVKPVDKKLDAPKVGWDEAWQKLLDAGVLTLPDAEELKCNKLMMHGTIYVVEYNIDNTYRTYMYSDPKYAECAEAKQILKINRIILEDYQNLEYKGE